MNPYEEELQKNIEDGQTPDADGMDVKAYQEVFRVLRQTSPHRWPCAWLTSNGTRRRTITIGLARVFFL